VLTDNVLADGREHKSREAKRYRLKNYMKDISKDCILNVLQFKSDRKDTCLEILQYKIDKKDSLIEKKDEMIDQLHKEIQKMRDVAMSTAVTTPRIDAPQTMVHNTEVQNIPDPLQEGFALLTSLSTMGTEQTESEPYDILFQSF